MDKVKIRILRLILIATLIILSLIVYRNSILRSVEYTGGYHLLSEKTNAYYKESSFNTGITNINGISNLYLNMQDDGYTIYKEFMTKDYIDVSFIKDGFPSYRYYYEYPSGKIAIFSSDYERSEEGVSYIINNKD